ncbi:cyclic AMP-dependent transcription factor ATF-7 [Anabrus simplex]|uniref:cyclic AMP-dependent transcription factor ATF-7 n=1 Tax=Anabrus simplex TaxID=316456 RepID=UPI0035A30254
MDETDKPFACTVDGCKMSFTNEDHLTVHKKKHDMVLNLGTGQKSNVFVADQTPTPTRFIRNCEEVGLFQDLQNVNPFEETFRKAVEAAKSGQTHLGVDSSLTVPSGTDDTLHTPHVFPHIIEDQTTSPVLISSTSVITENSTRKSPTREELDHSLHPSSTAGVGNGNSEVRSQHQRSTVKVVRQEADTSQQRIVTQQLLSGTVKKEASSNVQLILRMPDGKFVQVQGTSVEQLETVPILQVAAPIVTSPGAGTVVLSTHGTSVLSSSHPVITSSPPATVNNKMALAKERLKQQLIKSNRVQATSKETFLKMPMSNLVRTKELKREHHSASEGSESNSPPNRPRRCASADDIEKRKRFLERNREAAMRCRKKRKTWIQALEQRAEDMQRTNHSLQSEVAALRAEVAQLKTLLLAHKDCPVTHAMAQGVPAAPVSHSQHIINVTVPLITQNGLMSGATAVNSTVQQPMLMSTVPEHQVVLLNKPSIAKRRASNTVLSTPANKKPLVDNTVAPQTLLLTSAINSSESVNLVSTNSKPQRRLVANGSVGNVATTMVTGTNVVIPSVVVTPSQVQEVVQSDPSLVPMSLDQIPTILLPKSLCLSSVGMTQEHHTPSTNGDSTTGITPVIKLNPNVTRTDRTDSRGQHENKSISNGHGEDSDVEIIMEVQKESDGS